MKTGTPAVRLCVLATLSRRQPYFEPHQLVVAADTASHGGLIEGGCGRLGSGGGGSGGGLLGSGRRVAGGGAVGAGQRALGGAVVGVAVVVVVGLRGGRMGQGDAHVAQ